MCPTGDLSSPSIDDNLDCVDMLDNYTTGNTKKANLFLDSPSVEILSSEI